MMDFSNVAVVEQPSTPMPSSSLEIKPMTKEDCEWAGDIIIEGFRDKTIAAMGEQNLDVARRGVAHEKATRRPEDLEHVFIAWFEGQRAGYLSLKYWDVKRKLGELNFPGVGCCGWIRSGIQVLWMNPSLKEGWGYVETVSVDASMRGKGVGKALMEFADNQAREHGCHSISLHVTATNRARNLYERQGYTIKKRVDGCCFATCSAGERYCYLMVKKL